MEYIVIFTTSLGYIEGGINSFNFDICKAFGRVASEYKVVCFSLSQPLANIQLQAERNNVEIIALSKSGEELSIDQDLPLIKQKILELKNMSFAYLIGHDVFTGHIVNYLKSELGISCIAAIFHHMDYESYYSIKGGVPPNDLNRKIQNQKDILSRADMVIGIGPKLEESAKSKTSVDCFSIIPGINEIKPWRKISTLKGITFGRYDTKTDRLKQMKLAVKGFVTFVEKNREVAGKDALLKVVGIDKLDDSESLLSNRGGSPYIPINCLPYKSNREDLFRELSQSNVCLFLSVHDGFGLVGLEAIAAGVPLILSSNTGLYEFLQKEVGDNTLPNFGILCLTILGTNSEEVNEQDITSVEQALYSLCVAPDYYREGILKLRNRLKEKYTWEFAATTLIAQMREVKKKL